MAALEQGDEMKSELTEQLSVLLKEHGAPTLLRAMSASARGLAEEAPDEPRWLNAFLSAEQAAEALECDDGESSIEDEDEEDESDAPAETSAPLAPAARTEPAPSTQNEGDSTMKRDIPTPELVTHWRILRVVDGEGETERQCWGTEGVMHEEWPVRELSTETIRSRWGSGRYVLYWYSYRDGKLFPMGGGRKVHLVDRPTEPRATERPAGAARIPAPREVAPVAPSASGGSGELLAALAAMRNRSGSAGADVASMLQLLAFMEERQERARQAHQHEARIAEERHRADLEVQIERERLATKERIAHIEASAQVQARGRGGIDQQALVEALKEALSPADEGEESTPMTGLAAGSSDLAKIVDAVKEMLAPVLTAFVAKVMSDPSALPGAYKPSGT
ncbi:MAG: hypothetical protein ACLQBL_26915 [Polyangiaceae bacterium]